MSTSASDSDHPELASLPGSGFPGESLRNPEPLGHEEPFDANGAPSAPREESFERTPFDGRRRKRWVPSREQWSKTGVTIFLIAACMGVDIITRIDGSISFYFVFEPELSAHEPHRFLASAFLHANFWHLLLNMYVLWALGSVLESVIGHIRYLGIYLLSAVAGNAAVLLTADPLNNSWYTATVGASGAVFGLLGAQLVIARISGADLTGFIVFIVLNVVISLNPDSGISWQSHLGGFVAGVVTVYGFSRARLLPPGKRRIADIASFTTLAVLLIASVITWGYPSHA